MLPINTLNKPTKYTLEHSTSLSISVDDDGNEPAVFDEESENNTNLIQDTDVQCESPVKTQTPKYNDRAI
jgi:hypothetical protein